MFGPEVLPLKERPGKRLAHGPNEPINELVVRLPGDLLVTPSEVLRVVEAIQVVGTDVQHDW